MKGDMEYRKKKVLRKFCEFLRFSLRTAVYSEIQSIE